MKQKKKLKKELDHYIREGKYLMLNGKQSDPKSIIQACMLEEESSYMRDYIQDENNHVIGVGFDRVKIK
ncbi:MAG: hypothetical protein KHY79_03150 [Clostridiales bacterium]|nr:hypothetical protein [Clostridiales bacterium]